MHIACRFTCDDPLALHDVSVATHLFRIAQEAVSNALHHGGADEIMIDLALGQRPATLTISDNGVGFLRPIADGAVRDGPADHASPRGDDRRQPDVERTSGHTVVTCAFPTTSERDGDESPRLRR